MTDDKEQRTKNKKQRTKNKKQRTKNKKQITDNCQPTTHNPQPTTHNPQPSLFFFSSIPISKADRHFYWVPEFFGDYGLGNRVWEKKRV